MRVKEVVRSHYCVSWCPWQWILCYGRHVSIGLKPMCERGRGGREREEDINSCNVDKWPHLPGPNHVGKCDNGYVLHRLII